MKGHLLIFLTILLLAQTIQSDWHPCLTPFCGRVQFHPNNTSKVVSRHMKCFCKDDYDCVFGFRITRSLSQFKCLRRSENPEEGQPGHRPLITSFSAVH